MKSWSVNKTVLIHDIFVVILLHTVILLLITGKWKHVESCILIKILTSLSNNGFFLLGIIYRILGVTPLLHTSVLSVVIPPCTVISSNKKKEDLLEFGWNTREEFLPLLIHGLAQIPSQWAHRVQNDSVPR